MIFTLKGHEKIMTKISNCRSKTDQNVHMLPDERNAMRFAGDLRKKDMQSDILDRNGRKGGY